MAEIMPNNLQWYISQRWEEYSGEARANFLRLLCIMVFYWIHLINFFGLSWGPLEFPKVVDAQLHKAITFLTLSWTLLGCLVLLCVKKKIFPHQLKFVSTGFDVVMLTTILNVADGIRSPLIVSYFLIIALSAIRLSAALVWFSTSGAILGYLVLMVAARIKAEPKIPHYYSLIFLAALALCGFLLAQLLKRLRLISEDYHHRRTLNPGGIL